MPCTPDALLQTLTRSRNDMVALTQELVAIPTENPPGAHYDAAVGLLLTRLRALGFDDVRREGDCVLAFAGHGSRTLWFSGHYDVYRRSGVSSSRRCSATGQSSAAAHRT